MKKTTTLLIAITLSAAAAYAQTPVPEPDTVEITAPEIKVIKPKTNYTEDQIKILPTDIPAPVKRALESSTEYTGWQKAAIFKNRRGNLFTIEITKADTTKTYRFDARGLPVNE
jgi:hypothetical protein